MVDSMDNISLTPDDFRDIWTSKFLGFDQTFDPRSSGVNKIYTAFESHGYDFLFDLDGQQSLYLVSRDIRLKSF